VADFELARRRPGRNPLRESLDRVPDARELDPRRLRLRNVDELSLMPPTETLIGLLQPVMVTVEGG
jgi:hypothetical protein